MQKPSFLNTAIASAVVLGTVTIGFVISRMPLSLQDRSGEPIPVHDARGNIGEREIEFAALMENLSRDPDLLNRLELERTLNQRENDQIFITIDLDNNDEPDRLIFRSYVSEHDGLTVSDVIANPIDDQMYLIARFHAKLDQAGINYDSVTTGCQAGNSYTYSTRMTQGNRSTQFTKSSCVLMNNPPSAVYYYLGLRR